MPEYYSDVLEEEMLVPDFVVGRVVSFFTDVSESKLIPRHRAGSFSNQIPLDEWNYDVGWGKFNAWAFEIFDRFADNEQKQKFTDNQKALEVKALALADELYATRAAISDPDAFDMFSYLKHYIFDHSGNFLMKSGFAKWFQDYEGAKDHPFYNAYYLFQLPRLALEVIQKPHVDSTSSLANALYKAVHADPDITMYSIYRNGSEAEPNGYKKQLTMFWDDNSNRLILSIMKGRQKHSKHKIAVEPIKADKVKANLGVAAGLSAARDAQRHFNPHNTGMDVVRKKQRGGFNGPDRDDGPS